MPAEPRGLFSGIFQQGYSFGYVLAAVTNLAVGELFFVLLHSNRPLIALSLQHVLRCRIRPSLFPRKQAIHRSSKEQQGFRDRQLPQIILDHAQERMEDLRLRHHPHVLVQLVQSLVPRLVHHLHAHR